MSEWLKIEDYDDVVVSDSGDEIDVYLGADDFGNRCVTIPLFFIFEAVIKRMTNETHPDPTQP